MTDSLTLSRQHIETFLACRRRFQLRYLEHLPWPAEPLSEADEHAVQVGTQFHQMAQRKVLGLSAPAEPPDETVAAWWSRFEAFAPRLPAGTRHAELTLSVPVQVGPGQRHFLTGRFDLLVVEEDAPEPMATLFDWKTSPPRAVEALRHSWQTRLYLALLAEGGPAVLANSRRFTPERLSMTYWYAAEPETPRVIRYDAAQHRANWAELTGIVSAIAGCLETADWPMTDDLSLCRRCSYQAYDGRQEAGPSLPADIEEDEPVGEVASALEPDWL